MEGSDDGFTTTTGKKGGKQQKQKPQKEFKETVIQTATQQAEVKGKKKKPTTFMYANVEANEEEENKEQKEMIKTQQQQQTHDSEEEQDKHKGKKHQKQGGKKKKGKQQKEDSEEEQDQNTQTAVQEEEKKEEVIVEQKNTSGLPKEVIYCAICDLPPEYCMVDKKDSSECKNWLKNTHPLLFSQVYPETSETQEEEKKDGAQPAQTQKKKKKVGFGGSADPGQVKIYKTRRGGKKILCSVVGLQNFGVNLKDMAKLMSKKFASSAAVVDEDKYGECIQIQGDIEVRFLEFVESELAKYKVTPDRVKFEEVKKKKAADKPEGEQ